jgi:hypothetical protein
MMVSMITPPLALICHLLFEPADDADVVVAGR